MNNRRQPFGSRDRAKTDECLGKSNSRGALSFAATRCGSRQSGARLPAPHRSNPCPLSHRWWARIKPVSRNLPSSSGCLCARKLSLLVLYGLMRATSKTIAARLATSGLSDFAICSRRATFLSEMCDCLRNPKISSLSSMAWRALFGPGLATLAHMDFVTFAGKLFVRTFLRANDNEMINQEAPDRREGGPWPGNILSLVRTAPERKTCNANE
jgi:hypothetical protein